MSFSFASLADRFETATAVVRGVQVPLRAVGAADWSRCRELVPMPAPPLKRNPNKGSLAPLEPDDQDPAYRAQILGRLSEFKAIVVAVACGTLKVDVLYAGAVDNAKRETLAALSQNELERLYEIVETLGRGQTPPAALLLGQASQPPDRGEEHADEVGKS